MHRTHVEHTLVQQQDIQTHLDRMNAEGARCISVCPSETVIRYVGGVIGEGVKMKYHTVDEWLFVWEVPNE